MKRDDHVYVRHILFCIEGIEEYTQQLTFEKFIINKLIQDGVLGNLEIIGEAVKNICDEFRNLHTEIP